MIGHYVFQSGAYWRVTSPSLHDNELWEFLRGPCRDSEKVKMIHLYRYMLLEMFCFKMLFVRSADRTGFHTRTQVSTWKAANVCGHSQLTLSGFPIFFFHF